MTHLTEDRIKHMVDRFLSWKLPSNFNPDAGISFKADFNEHTAYPMKHEPSGTNLFDATQADAMVRYMIEGLGIAQTRGPSPVKVYIDAISGVWAIYDNGDRKNVSPDEIRAALAPGNGAVEADRQVDTLTKMQATEDADIDFVLGRLGLATSAGCNREIIRDFRKQIIQIAAALAAPSPAALDPVTVEAAAKYLDDIEGGMGPCKSETPSQIAEKLRAMMRRASSRVTSTNKTSEGK